MVSSCIPDLFFWTRCARSTTKPPKVHQITNSSCIPDDCWEYIFKFIINDDLDYSRRRSLSLVSKQFLSITNNSLPFSLTPKDESTCCRLVKRFTNLNSLKLTGNYIDLDNLLIEISSLPLKQLTSLDLSNQPTLPAIGLRAFSKKITTLTSLTCSYVDSINTSDLFLIAECFPLLQELNLRCPNPIVSNNSLPRQDHSSSYVDGIEALSLALIKLRKVNLSEFPINDKSLFHLFNNCKLLQQVIMFDCDVITYRGLAYALHQRPTLTSLSFSITPSNPEYSQVLTTEFIDSLNSAFHIAPTIVMLELGLSYCTDYSYAGTRPFLEEADYLTDQHVVQLSSFLGDLVSINLSCCYELTESILLALARKCPSLSKIIMETFWIKNDRISDSLVLESDVYPQLKSLYLCGNPSDESLTMFASIFPNLELFDLDTCTCVRSFKWADLYSCPWLSEGNCQDLRKCCDIKHFNVADWSRMKLL